MLRHRFGVPLALLFGLIGGCAGDLSPSANTADVADATDVADVSDVADAADAALHDTADTSPIDAPDPRCPSTPPTVMSTCEARNLECTYVDACGKSFTSACLSGGATLSWVDVVPRCTK